MTALIDAAADFVRELLKEVLTKEDSNYDNKSDKAAD